LRDIALPAPWPQLQRDRLFGIVVISPSFLDKEWPQRELDALVALEVQSGKTKILPIWLEIDKG
jgi:hypothetical protein